MPQFSILNEVTHSSLLDPYQIVLQQPLLGSDSPSNVGDFLFASPAGHLGCQVSDPIINASSLGLRVTDSVVSKIGPAGCVIIQVSTVV